MAPFGAEGDDFDPVLHEAMQHEGDGSEDSRPVIGNVLRHGYKLGDQVLRHALVGVVDTIPDASTDAAETAAADTVAADTLDNDANEGEHNAESEPSDK